MIKALERLDQLLVERRLADLTLIIGGGCAMILAHGFTLGTSDIDAIPRGLTVSELDPMIKEISREQKLSSDWLNPYFSTFAHTLPEDYGQRLVEVFKGAKLKALALGKEEMLIMKCFAHRQKDVPHAKTLIIGGADVKKVEAHIEMLQKKKIPGASHALDFLDDIQDQL
ncbi:MAG: DUF6036 family nucleotidyltransferase [Bdellovibrionota bacterium]